MSRRKNTTDQPFREQLRHFEAAPPELVWHGIANALHGDKRKMRVIWLSRIAASIVLLLALGTAWFLLREPPETRLVTREKRASGNLGETGKGKVGVPEIKDDMNVRTTPKESPDREAERKLEEPHIPSSQAGPSTDTGEPTAGVPGERPHMDRLNTIAPISVTGLQTDFTDREALLSVAAYPPPVPAAHEGIDVFEEWGDGHTASHGKWGVGTQVSPIYSYRSLEVAGGSASSASYYNDLEGGIVSYAGGVNVHYAPLKRLSLQSGLYYSSMGMKVGNAYYARVDNSNSFMDETIPKQASIANSTGTIKVSRELDDAYVANTVPPAGWELASQEARVNTLNAAEGEILQQFEYLELPLILRYRVVDRRLGFHFLGGLSSNFLVGNSAYYQEDGNKELIGSTDNLRRVNYSSILGLGVDYSISKRFHVNLEPTFRYYLNSINTGSMIKSYPYTIGFFTGLLYTF